MPELFENDSVGDSEGFEDAVRRDVGGCAGVAPFSFISLSRGIGSPDDQPGHGL